MEDDPQRHSRQDRQQRSMLLTELLHAYEILGRTQAWVIWMWLVKTLVLRHAGTVSTFAATAVFVSFFLYLLVTVVTVCFFSKSFYLFAYWHYNSFQQFLIKRSLTIMFFTQVFYTIKEFWPVDDACAVLWLKVDCIFAECTERHLMHHEFFDKSGV